MMTAASILRRGGNVVRSEDRRPARGGVGALRVAAEVILAMISASLSRTDQINSRRAEQTTFGINSRR
jgi:hypothetical protein